MTAGGFDPGTDLELEEFGIYRWTEHAISRKPKMVAAVAGYFSERNDDELPRGMRRAG